MRLGVLKAKVRRNGFIISAGKYYKDESSEIVKKLKSKGEKALIGIQKKNGIYTVIGQDFIHYLTPNGKHGKILLNEFIKELEQNLSRKKTSWLMSRLTHRNIVLSNSDKVWLCNSDVLYTLWNTIDWLEKLSDKGNG